jgi:hypothetical protein
VAKPKEIKLDDQIAALSKEQLEDLYFSLGDWDQKPVTIDEFLDSPEYLGPYFQGNLYPFWREVLREIYPSPYVSPYWCISFRGAIGLGKTTVACAGVAYDLYLLLCLSKPQREVGLIEATKIVFAIFNVTLSLATDVVWDTLSQMFIASPFFSKFLGPLGKKRRNEETLFPKRIDFFMGSRVGHTLGKAVYDAILSEANFEIMEGQVYESFNSLLRRMSSRFMKQGGGVVGKIWVDSSESDKFSTVNQIIDKYKNDPGVFVVQRSLWEVATHRYGKARFWVYKGSESRQPEIITSDSPLITFEPENCIEVPVEHKRDFEADIHAALRDLAGVSTRSTYKLFRHRDKLNRSMRVAPLFQDSITLDFDDEADQIWEKLISPSYFKNPVNKNVPRYVHIDIGLTGDRLGIAASYIRALKERKSRDHRTFQEVVETVPEIVTEWAVGITPSPGKQVPLFKIRAFLQWLTKQGYIIAGVSADGYQSADMLQTLATMGFSKTEVISLDKTSTAYIQFRNAVYEDRHHLPINKILKRECEELEVTPDGKKVDHPKRNTDGTDGSKDIADAACGSAFFAVQNVHTFNIMQLIPESGMTQTDQSVANMIWPDRDQSHRDHDDFNEE